MYPRGEQPAQPTRTMVAKNYLLLNNFQIRHVLQNGSLYFPKFETGAFRQDVHWATYKCVASNSGGSIISRDLTVKAGKCVNKMEINFIS